MSLTEQSIRNLLEIKDQNILFHEDTYLGTVKKQTLIIPAILIYLIDRCVSCKSDRGQK
jgi:hypothetical protein